MTMSSDEPKGYSIEREPEDGTARLKLSGEMDLRAAGDLRDALLHALGEGDGSVSLDMGGLTFLDSTIISVLIMARKRASTAGGEVRLCAVPRRVERILTITGIESLFTIVGASPTEETPAT
jgi:anti-sigma B factor antagonist